MKEKFEMVTDYNIAICRQDKILILNLSQGEFDKTAFEAYALTVLRSPDIQDICAKHKLSKGGFFSIALSLINSFPEQCIVLAGQPMLAATLIFIEPERFARLTADLDDELGAGWSERINEQIATEVFKTSFRHAEFIFSRYLVSGSTMSTTQAARKIVNKPPLKGCLILVIAVIAICILLFK